jgi:hypothetical protein
VACRFEEPACFIDRPCAALPSRFTAVGQPYDGRAVLGDELFLDGEGGDSAEELTSGGVDVADAAAQAYRAGAGGGVPDVIKPGVVPG